MTTRHIPNPQRADDREPRLRARDLRAIAFLLLSTLAVLAASWSVMSNLAAALVVTAAYAVWLATRPRMLRVARRLRGERVEHISYYSN
ncbi:hypothetical protein P7B02_01960 [Caulobacter segnis]|uniref:hypothetical protein n=1 Tax=Caulobacter segnis TaxID=88688 RepID=UPI00240F1E93|nr:hypothetical protein [Caulobacter segnis]MDG2520290.1 hypothetical protein [Caulobacter segnis]